MKRRLIGLAIAGLLVATQALAGTQIRNNTNYAFEDQGPWTEGAYTLPLYPAMPDWVGFYVFKENPNKYFVDAKSLTIGEDGVIRFILRVQSPSGAENLSVEGIQCKQGTYRSYAFGDSYNKRWIESTRADWRKIEYEDKTRRVLREDMCPERDVPKLAEDAIKLLRSAPWR